MVWRFRVVSSTLSAMGKIVPFRPRITTGSDSAGSSRDEATTTFEGPSRVRVCDWATCYSVSVAWKARHVSGLPLVHADGTLLIGDPALEDDPNAVAVGRLVVVKACLATGEDLEVTMRTLSGRHAELAKDVFDRYRFSEDFETWCEEEHGQHPLEDPLFLLEHSLDVAALEALEADRGDAYELPLARWVAALSAIDALAVLGALGSPLLTFEHTTGTGEDTPWLRALGARRWRPDVLVAFRPDP